MLESVLKILLNNPQFGKALQSAMAELAAFKAEKEAFRLGSAAIVAEFRASVAATGQQLASVNAKLDVLIARENEQRQLGGAAHDKELTLWNS